MKKLFYLFSILASLAISGSAEASSEATSNLKFKTLEFFEPHFSPVEKGIKGVLILATDISKPGVVLEHPRWTKFATENQFGLMSVGFKIAPGIRDRDEVGRELAKLIDEAATKKFGGKLKRFGYARSWGA